MPDAARPRPFSVPFAAAALPIITEVLGCAWREASYRIHGDPVYETTLPNLALSHDLRLVVWLPIARVDAYLGDCQLIFKEINEVHVLPGVEVIFRRRPAPGHLLVTTTGRVAIAA